MIFILTHTRDGSADMVINHLEQIGAEFFRFNTDEFPQKVSLELNLDLHSTTGALRLPKKEVSLSDISSVWNRRPHRTEIDERVKDPTIRSWAQEEADQALRCFYSLLEDQFWVNSGVAQDRVQFNKWLQMKVANEVGLETPPSILTNDPEAVKRFWEVQVRDVAIKPIKGGVLHYRDGRTTVLHTRRIPTERLNEETLGMIAVAPVFLQRYIEKKVELRVTVVGNRVFTCEIYSQQDPLTKEDWRGHIFTTTTVPHKAATLPKAIEEKCRHLVSRLGLVFGAIDMILTPDNRYVFLEINPNGQWAWIEQLTGMPISQAIAELLAHSPKA